MTDATTCDVCKEEIKGDCFYGRWFMYCMECKKNGKGKQADNAKTFENEILPDIENGDYSYTVNQDLSDVLLEVL